MAKRGRIEEARDVLCAVWDLEPDDPYICGEIEAIQAALALESGVTTFTSLFKTDILQTRKRVILAWYVVLLLST